MSLPKKKPQRERTLEQRAQGITSFVEDVSPEDREADTDAIIETASAHFSRIQDETDVAQKMIRRNSKLSGEGQADKLVEIGLAAGSQVIRATNAASTPHAKRMDRTRAASGGSGELLTGREILRNLVGRETTSAFDPASAGTAVLIPGILDTTRNELLRLASNNEGAALLHILSTAASTGDVATWGSIDHRVPPWLRAKILGIALISPEMDQRLHRELRAMLDPKKHALMKSLIALGHHLISNARTVLSYVELVTSPDRSGSVHKAHLNLGLAEGEKRLEQRLDEVLAPLRTELRHVGEDAFFSDVLA